MSDRIHTDLTASITELKNNPMNLLSSSDGEPIAILNHNKPAFYCVPTELYEDMLEMLEDAEIREIVAKLDGTEEVEVGITDL